MSSLLPWRHRQSRETTGLCRVGKHSRQTAHARGTRESVSPRPDAAYPGTRHNGSERALRREAIGRKNWLFVGNDDAGEVNAAFVSLLASCQLHDIEPWTYLRDLFCLLPNWPRRRVLELAPLRWNKTLENQETQQRLEANIFKRATLGLLDNHSPSK